MCSRWLLVWGVEKKRKEENHSASVKDKSKEGATEVTREAAAASKTQPIEPVGFLSLGTIISED